MSRMKKTILTALVLTLGLSTAGQAGWYHFANNVRTPDGNLVHDGAMVQMSVVATEMNSSWACVRYSRDSKKLKQGRVKSTARYLLDGEEIRKIDFVERVTQNRVLNCKKGPKAPVGTVVEFTHQFLGMPRVFGKKGEYIDVSGVVGAKILQPVIAFDAGTLALMPAEDDGRGRIASASSLFVADQASQRHPVALSQTAIANRAFASPKVCVSYRRAAGENRNQGRFVATSTVIYPNGQTEKLEFGAGVSKGEAVRCKDLSRDVPVGTVVESDIQFQKMPRLRDLKASPEHFMMNTSISTAGDVDFRPPPAAPVVDAPPSDPGSGTPPPPPPPGGGGPLNAADQRCISRVLYAGGSGSRQIVRPRGNKGGKFEVFGPRSAIANGKAVPATLGFGSTYALACNDYERKMGSLGPEGSSLSGSDVGGWIWYSNLSSAAGPTAVRKDPRGGFHGDYWRPWSGVVILNGGSPGAILKALQSRGL